jgi:hypothetical protein
MRTRASRFKSTSTRYPTARFDKIARRPLSHIHVLRGTSASLHNAILRCEQSEQSRRRGSKHSDARAYTLGDTTLKFVKSRAYRKVFSFLLPINKNLLRMNHQITTNKNIAADNRHSEPSLFESKPEIASESLASGWRHR